ncbi:MAG: replication-associated recombination protein A [Bacteroidia bacterium]|nr:replication-associated recombination protein A [Bacteroidia bacterium]
MPAPPLPPLAERMRPQSLDQVVGQGHLVGPGAPLRRLLEADTLASLILWGPPGVGKTTLARLLAQALRRPFATLSAVSSGVRELRAILEAAETTPGTVLFIDEIHRFNKAQQDALLHGVESGTVTLIGATTENPSFEVIGALLSRCQVYVLEALSRSELEEVLRQALARDVVLGGQAIELLETEALYNLSSGDARRALNLLELVVSSSPARPLGITDAAVVAAAQQKTTRYDKAGEQHYDTISAFIKSIRGSDPNAGLYYLARMLEGGEEVRFIARRLVILASEDIGNANPNALLLATACFQACDVIGLPEARIILAQAVTYLATSPKSNAAYLGIAAAQAAVARQPDLPVPLHIRNAPTRLMKELGYNRGYKYSHDYAGAEGNQDFLPQALSRTVFYQPKPVGKEKELLAFLRRQWAGHYDYGEPTP